jgi:hypothetical protein
LLLLLSGWEYKLVRLSPTNITLSQLILGVS